MPHPCSGYLHEQSRHGPPPLNLFVRMRARKIGNLSTQTLWWLEDANSPPKKWCPHHKPDKERQS